MSKKLYDFLCQLNLGLQKNIKTITVAYSKTIFYLIKKFFKLRIISMYKVDFIKTHVVIFLHRMYKHISYKCNIISKPSKRVYISLHDLKKNKFNFRFYHGRLILVSTHYGFCTLNECFKYKTGGELLCIF